MISGDWRLYEDRPGKPGWIATTPNATLEFPLRFGGLPRATLAYTQGYAAAADAAQPPWGELELRIGGVVDPYTGLPYRAPAGPAIQPRFWEGAHARVDALRSDGQRVTQQAFLGIAAHASKVRRAPSSKPAGRGASAPPARPSAPRSPHRRPPRWPTMRCTTRAWRCRATSTASSASASPAA